MARQSDIEFPYQEMFKFYPDVKTEFQKLAGTRDIHSFFREKIFSDKYQDIKMALQYYGAYEYQLGSMMPEFKAPSITDSKINNLKIFLTYVNNRMFLKENYILKNIDKIKDDKNHVYFMEPDDFCCPLENAWLLHKKMRRSTLIINDDYNHGSEKLKKRLKKECKKFFEKYL